MGRLTDVAGYKGLSKYFGITIGKCRWYVENDCFPKPYIEEVDVTGRITRVWKEKDLKPYKELIHLSAPEIIKIALHYKKENEKLKTQLSKYFSIRGREKKKKK